MFIRTADGKVMDVGNKIKDNVGFSVLRKSPINIGNNVRGYSENSVVVRNASNSVLAYGNWFKVDDDSVLVTVASSILGDVTYIWNLPNGSSIKITAGEVTGNAPLWHWSDTYNMTGVYVKLTSNTAPGFRALGIIPKEKISDVVNNDTANPTPPSTGEVVQSSVRGIVLLAILGTAIYFYKEWKK